MVLAMPNAALDEVSAAIPATPTTPMAIPIGTRKKIRTRAMDTPISPTSVRSMLLSSDGFGVAVFGWATCQQHEQAQEQGGAGGHQAQWDQEAAGPHHDLDQAVDG